ncbi:MAG: hypothetical protein WBF53_13090 [Litorimonas sp.]
MFAAAMGGWSATPALASDDLCSAIQADYDANLDSLFIHLHEYPEVSVREFGTSKRIASEPTALGYEVTAEMGRTGVVAMLETALVRRC